MSTDEKMDVNQNDGRVFDVDSDVQVFVENLRHIGGDNRAIVEVVASRTRSQRLEIAKKYKEKQGRDLHVDLKVYTYFDFQRVLRASFMSPVQYDVWSIHAALEEFGTDEKSLVEIFVSRSNSQIKEIRDLYHKTYDHDVDDLIRRKTRGDFCDMLLMLAEPSRDESNHVPMETLRRDVKALARSIRKGGAIQNYAFSEIFCRKNFYYMRAIFELYQQMSERDIYQDIRLYFNGHMKSGLKAIAEYTVSPTGYFAHRLYRSMKGLGTDDNSLTRIIVTRSEVDMDEIKRIFKERYKNSLESFIVGDTSFSYKHLLLKLVS